MSQARILVVDDEPHLAGALCRALSLLGTGAFAAESCGSAEAALAHLAATPVDVLVTDLRLPGMDGLQLIRQARTLLPEVRTILMTAYGTAEIEALSLNLADAYLAKPFSLSTFVQSVKRVQAVTPRRAA